MRVIIAGTRTIRSLPLVRRAIEESGFDVTEVVSGGARGVDGIGEVWARIRKVPTKVFPADWSQGKKAGPLRNEQMAAYADALVAVWNGKSRGTADMIERAKAHGLKVHVFRLPHPESKETPR